MGRLGSSVESVRRDNLSTVLRLVHRSGGLSRAELTAVTGLNRSTVAEIATELVSLGWAEAGAPQPTRRVGRPSPMVLPSLRPAVFAVNPEVDAVTIGVVGLSAQVVEKRRIPVREGVSAEEVLDLVADHVAQCRARADFPHRIMGIGAAIPGLVRRDDGVIRWAPHLKWRDEPFAQELTARTGLPAVLDNDASAGVVAEQRFGAGIDVDDIVYVNGGASGIGGGIIAGGALITGARGYAGELGHNRPGPADPNDRLTVEGALEVEVARRRLLAAAGIVTPIDDTDLAAALADSPAAFDELARQRRILAVSVANTANVLNPSLVILGGFLAIVRDSDPDDFDDRVATQVFDAEGDGLRIATARLGSDLLMIGAAELAFERLIADPSASSQGATTDIGVA